MARVHAFTDDVLGTLDAVGVADALRRGDFSTLEAVEASIARIESVDPELGAMAYRTFDRARVQARSPRAGFFAGVPTLVKDNTDVLGVPTRNGTDSYVAGPATRNEEVVKLLGKLGLISLGKSQLSEFGFSATAEHPRFGPVRNPWDTALASGASSAGAGALVAAGSVPLAHGNDGGGSLRIPASACGVVGFKPTRDRLPKNPLYGLLPVNLVVDGVLTRSVRDTAAFLREAERVHHTHLPPIGDVTGPSAKRLRIAMYTEALGRSAAPEVADLVRKTAAVLEELGHTVEEVAPPVPAGFDADFVLYWGSLAVALANAGPLRGRTWDRTRLDNLTLGLSAATLKNARTLPAAINRLRRSTVLAEGFHAAYDVVLTPTVSHATPEIGYLAPTQPYELVLKRLMDWVAFTPWQNVTGGPAVSLPVQRTASGLPQGMMFGAAPGAERTLLEVAFELEEAMGFADLLSAPALP
ncbi:amidase [Nocardioides sp. NPDC059952]|uniref:amidase n=1 Tax=Nocardioides sp. NPDC059952 TaxID=3347014 RepID=UPI0036604A8E